MKKNSTIILSAAAVLWALNGSQTFAQDIQVADGWGSSSQQSDSDLGGGSSAEEDALLQSLYNEEDDEELTRVLQSEDYIFPTSITDNWHLIFHAGLMNSWGSYDSEANWFNRTNFGAAFSIGKYLTPVNDVRLQLFYGRGTAVRGWDNAYEDPYDAWQRKNHWIGNFYDFYNQFERDGIYPYHQDQKHIDNCPIEPDGKTHIHDSKMTEEVFADGSIYHWNVLSLSAAYLPNLTNLIWGYDPDRRFTVSGIMGISLNRTWGYTNKHLSMVSLWAEQPRQSVHRSMVGLQFGAQCEYILNHRWHVNFEATENYLDDTFDGLISDQKHDGHLNLLLGATYFLKGKHQDGRIQNRNPFEDKYLNYTEKIYKNREAIEDALAARPDSVRIVDVTKNVTYTLISFDEEAMEVPRLQQNNVYQTAEAYRRNPGSKIFITNSNKEDNNLFHLRAWSISKLLNQRWQIPLENVWVDADESHIQKLQIPDCKHYIIFIINEE